MSEKRKVHFISLGCPKNRVDSEIMLGTLEKKGYQLANKPEEAETIVVNTCGFIEDAKQESISTILDMSQFKQSGNLKKLVVAGCLTQRYKEELVEGLPEVDIFVGSGEFQNLDEILKQSFEGNDKKTYFNLPTYLQQESTPRKNSMQQHMAYLKISEGCKKRCAFCAIPLIRGNLQSRKIESVVSEAKLLVAGGVRELIVISHDFTDYGWDLNKINQNEETSPYLLLKRLSEESGAEWIRVLYLYPDGIDEKTIDLINEKPNLLKYFDMPLQHINDSVLKRMNRRLTRKQIENAITLIRSKVPEAVIRTQFIVGFPGETEEQFNELLNFVEVMEFDRVGCFKYSLEEDTKAATYSDQISEEIKEERYQRLMQIQQKVSRKIHKRQIGQVVPVIVEGLSEETDLLLKGRTSFQAPEIDGVIYINDGEANVGDLVNVEITDAHDYDFVGHIV